MLFLSFAFAHDRVAMVPLVSYMLEVLQERRQTYGNTGEKNKKNVNPNNKVIVLPQFFGVVIRDSTVKSICQDYLAPLDREIEICQWFI